jgi:hypothetical protein
VAVCQIANTLSSKGTVSEEGLTVPSSECMVGEGRRNPRGERYINRLDDVTIVIAAILFSWQ